MPGLARDFGTPGPRAVLDALGRYPALWRGAQADPADRLALAELAACLVGYNLSPDGAVTPRSTYQGFASMSFGQKKRPSGFATARVLAVLHRIVSRDTRGGVGRWPRTSKSAIGLGDDDPEDDVDDLADAEQPEEHEADPHQEPRQAEAVGEGGAHPGDDPAAARSD